MPIKQNLEKLKVMEVYIKQVICKRDMLFLYRSILSVAYLDMWIGDVVYISSVYFQKVSII